MASGIKHLAYPQTSIDERLAMAHEHHNMQYLDAIGDEEISKIENSALKDLSNVTIATFSKKMQDTGLAFNDVIDSNYYVRAKGRWAKLLDVQAFPNLTSTTLDVTGSGTKALTVNLKSVDIDAIKSIGNKLDKIASPKQNEVVLANTDGTIKSSGIDINSVIIASKLVQDASTNTSTTSAVSAKAANDIYKRINTLTDGIGKPRGVVVNAFLSMGSAATILSLPPVKSGGNGYTVGSLVRLYTNTSSDLIPAVARVTDVEGSSGAIKSIEIVTGGSYSELSASTVFHAIPSYKSPSGTDVATLFGSYTYSSVAKTTLASIAEPRVGDTAYVLQDENNNNFQAIYNYVESSGIGYWVRIISFSSPDSNYVMRFNSEVEIFLEPDPEVHT